MDLAGLFKHRRIDLLKGAVFDQPPPPKGSNFSFNRIEGMLLGLAVGDALGNTTESMLPRNRMARHGEITDYLWNGHANAAVGVPSDDTQLTFWTLEELNRSGEFIPAEVAARFYRERIFGIGSTVKAFISNYKAGKPWHECGVKSAGNGALMRIAPILIPHLKTASTKLWEDTALAAMITHNDSGSIAACLAFIKILWDLLDMSKVPDPSWWLDTYVGVARDLERHNYRPRADHLDFRGPIWALLIGEVKDAFQRGLTVREACRIWYSGAFLLETVPSVIYILMLHADDPEEAIIRAVNDTKDNDTIAALVGAAVGALHGKEKLPERWLRNLSGRTSADDDGRIFELMQQARQRFWSDSGE